MSKPLVDLNTISHLQARRAWIVGILMVCCLLLSNSSFAQSDRHSAVSDVTKQVLTDPTTYTPSILAYGSLQLDWNSSQPFFQNGYFEENGRYTRTGRPHDIALSYGAGNRKIIGDSLAILPASLANNALNRVLQRGLNERFPAHRRLWSTIAWVERAAFASYSASVVASPHFEQWKKNARLAKELGY